MQREAACKRPRAAVRDDTSAREQAKYVAAAEAIEELMARLPKRTRFPLDVKAHRVALQRMADEYRAHAARLADRPRLERAPRGTIRERTEYAVRRGYLAQLVGAMRTEFGTVNLTTTATIATVALGEHITPGMVRAAVNNE